MKRHLVVTLLSAGALAVLAGCNRRERVSRDVVAKSLEGVMLYPKSQPMTLSSGDSAGQLVLFNADPPDSVARWYRNALDRAHWTLQSDQQTPDGAIHIYAERGQRPIWISIERASGAGGTTYTLTGAISGSADSTATDSIHRSGSSMSSKRIQRR